MHRRTLIPTLALFSLALAAPALADGPADAPVVEERIPDVNKDEAAALERGERAADEGRPALLALPHDEVVKLSPAMQEIRAELAREQEALAELRARLDRAPDARAALAIEHEIAAVKQGCEVEILRIQARHARLAGDEERARDIELAVEQILDPPRTGVPSVKRPVPTEG